MSEQDNLLLILEKISDVKESVGVLKNEFSHMKEDLKGVKEELNAVTEQDKHQNKLLDEHIAGVRTAMEMLQLEKTSRLQDSELVQKQIEELNARIKRAEFLPNFAVSLKKILVWTAGFLVACGTIAKYLHWF